MDSHCRGDRKPDENNDQGRPGCCALDHDDAELGAEDHCARGEQKVRREAKAGEKYCQNTQRPAAFGHT